MRIYCAVTRAELEVLDRLGRIESDLVSGLTIFAQTQQWIAEQDESDPEVLDDEILQQAAQVDTGYVLVAEVVQANLTEQNPVAGLVQANMPIRLKDVAAFFQVDKENDISWFGPTELPVLLELGR
jgi:cytolysin (calcineurin-like family phosphatase)